MRKEYDIVIIGSGVGGGTAAEYFSHYIRRGLSVLLLESGPYRKRNHFNQLERDMTSIYYNRGGVFSKNLHIGLAAANTVGGGSAVYTGVSFRPPASVLQKWRNDYGMDFLTDDFMNHELDYIEHQINIAELPESWDNDNNRLFKEGAEKLGIPVKRLRINVKNCGQQGFCNLGCTKGAKQGTLEVQIPFSLEAGVELIYNAKVEKLEENSVYFHVSPAPCNSLPNEVTCGEHNVKAKIIVLAAGVLHTPVLLHRSAASLKIKTKNIGRYVTLHPAFNVNGIYKNRISNFTGFPKTMYIDEFSDSHDFYLETSFYLPGVTAKNQPYFGVSHQNIMKEYSKMMSILILSHDKAESHNRIRTDKYAFPVLDYTVSSETRKALVSGLRKSAEIFFAAGCSHAFFPACSKQPLFAKDLPYLDNYINEHTLKFEKTPLSSAHPQGGARMGAEPAFSVTDLNGKVIGTKSVYIVDASLFPTSVKVNPYETIMLLSRHVSDHIIKTLN